VRPAALLIVVLAATGVSAQEWPQFRGPTGQGHSDERGLPTQWSETTNIAWKVPVPGSGWSSPVVSAGRVWMTSAVEQGRGAVSLRALAFDAETGREVVNAEVTRIDGRGYINPKNSRATPTPIVAGDRVYVHFGADGTAALTTSGEVVWRARYRYDSQHGSGSTPIVYGDLLIFNCDGNYDEAFVVALDTRTGKERWKRARRKPADQAYTTPLVIRVGEQDQLISVGAYRAYAYEPMSGREIWRVSYDEGFSNVPRPVYGHGLVFIATGFNQPTLIAVRPEGQGDVTRTHIAWTLRRGAPFTPSPLIVGDELYVINDIGILTVLDAKTGTMHYQQRLGGNYSASPVFADGRIYFQSEEGMTTVIPPGRQFGRLAVNRLDGSTLASMAVAGGVIFIRSDTHLYRVGSRQ
jgi:outer membrane protein assembly factor BamB